MSTVDNRIVNMTFNNRDFERNAAQSTQTLDKLERTIANTGKSKGLQDMASQATNVSSKFSAMQVAGVAAIATITAKAVDAGLRMAKSLTITPLMQGFQEYQTNLNSVQTIMSNTGENVKTVNKYLDKLNRYSDQTVYNFSEMARNIGTFTAAGVDLDTATDSIKGIANLAALSGSNSQQASTAMYQLSQAIAAGRVGLMDWNSVVNAGMGGKIFQTALARTGQNMGKIADGAIGAEGPMKRLTIAGESFRESIGGGDSWLNGDILVETLKQISGGYSVAQLKAKGYTAQQIKDIQDLADTAFKAATNIKTLPQLFQVVQESMGSMWAKTFMLILGDFEQSKELWGNVGAAIVGPNGFVTKLNTSVEGYLKEWAEMGGRDDMLRGFERAFKNVWRILVPFKNAFRDIFPPSTTNNFVKITEAFKDFAEFLKPSVKTMHSLRSVFRGVFAVLHIGFTIVKAIAAGFGALFEALFKGAGPGRDGILSIAAAIGETLVALDEWLTGGGRFIDIMKQIGNTVGAVISPLIAIIGGAASAIGGLFSGIGVGGVTGSIDLVKDAVLELVSNILDGLSRITAPFESLSSFFDGLKTKVDGIRGSFEGFSTPFDQGKAKVEEFQQALGPGMDKVEGATSRVTGAISGGLDKVTGASDKAQDSVKGMLDTVSGSSGQAATATTDQLSSASETASSGLERLKDLLSNVASGIGNAFGHLGETFAWVKQQFSDLFGNFDGMDWVAFFNAIFSGALILTLRNFAKNFGGIGAAIKDTFGQLTDTLKAMQQAIKARAIRDIAIGVALLAASMLVLSLLDVKTLGKSLGAISVMLGLLVGSLATLSKISAGGLDILALSTSLALISFGMLQLATSVAILGRMDMDELARGVGAMGAALGLMVGAIKLLSGVEGALKSAAFGIVLMAGAMLILAGAVLAFGKMNMKTLSKGLGAMGIGLGLMVGAMMKLSFGGPAIASAASSIVLVSGAMVLLAVAVSRMGKLDMETLAKGLGAMAVALILVVGAIAALGSAGPAALFGAGAILLIAIALEKIALVIAGLGLLPFKVVASGLAIVGAALAILLAAGAIAMVIAPGLIALGIAVGLLGAGMLLAGAGMALFGAGFAVFAAAGVAGVAVLSAAFEVFLALLPTLATQLAASLVAFLKAMAAAAPKIRKSLGTIIKNMLGTVRDAIPEIGATFSALLNEGLRILKDSGPRFIDAGFAILMAFLRGLDENIEEIAQRASSIAQKFMRELGNQAKPLAEAGADMLIDTLHGLADAIREKDDLIVDAAWDLARAFGEALKTAFSSILSNIDIGSFLPDFNPKDWAKGMLGRGATGKAVSPWEVLANTIKDSAVVVADTMDEVIRYITDRDYPEAIVNAALGVNAAQLYADKLAQGLDRAEKVASFAEAKAEKAKEKAEKLREKAKQKDATKKQKQAAEKAAKEAAKLNQQAKIKRARVDIFLPSKADLAQRKADFKAAQLDVSKNLNDAVSSGDLEGAGDIKADQAADLAQRAKEMLAKSQADQKAAEKLAKGNAKERKLAEKMRQQAQKEAELAAQWAQQARDAMDAATNYYRDAAQQRMADIIAQHEQAQQDLAEQQEFDAADNAGKAAIMERRAQASRDKAAAAEAAYQAAIAAAEVAIANGDLTAANAQLDIAEQQAAIAAQAAQDASDQAQQAQQYAEQAAQEAQQNAASGGSGSSSSSNIQGPSRTALEDAAKAVDRYTQSVMDAEEAAQSGLPILQFSQVNHSPQALSVSEIYRQSNNLVSYALKKIAP